MRHLPFLLLLCGYLTFLARSPLLLFSGATNVTTVATESEGLLNEFRAYYHQFNVLLARRPTNSFLVQQLNEDLNQFSTLVESHADVFTDETEWQILRTNLQAMLVDGQALHNQALQAPSSLLNECRAHYHRFVELVAHVQVQQTDLFLLQLLGEDLDEFYNIVNSRSPVFTDQSEWQLLRTNLQSMLIDVRALYNQGLEQSHRGHLPAPVYRQHDGSRGRPRIVIDRDFLQWAYTLRTANGIADYLGVSRNTVRRSLLDYGIVQPGLNPFPTSSNQSSSSLALLPVTLGMAQPNDVADDDNVLDPDNALPRDLPEEVRDAASSIASSSSGNLSNMSDEHLDSIIQVLRSHYAKAGIRMLQGMLRRLGYNLPYERVRQSLIRIDPVHRIFDRIRIRRRRYEVLGPNSLWHHDGHHRLIRWGIVIHGFIDGYSRMITGMRASNNNRRETVLSVFMSAANLYGVPSRIRGDHGHENVWVAAFMEHVRGAGRGSYIWGRSVHNVRIERLWVDVSNYISQRWNDAFTSLELRHDLDVRNTNHIWLLQYLFLGTINEALTFWAESWNHHHISQRHGQGPSRSPEDMFGFDMLVHGLRGDSPDQFSMTDEELEVFGIDWEGLQDDALLRSLRRNYAQEDGSSTWFGRRGPPPNLTEVRVDPPIGILSTEQLTALDNALQHIPRGSENNDIVALWTSALAYTRTLEPNEF